MMTKAAVRIALSMLVVAGAGCAVRMRATPAETAPAALPRRASQAAPSRPAATERAVAGTGSENVPAPPAPTRTSSTATSSTVGADVPASAGPAYVFAPEDAVAAPPSSTRPGGAPPESAIPAQPDAAPRERRDGTSARTPGALRLVVVASVPVVAVGAIVTVDVMASSSSAVVDAPMHLTFDSSVLEFIDGAPGDFLTQGGSSVVFLADGTSRPGDVAIAAGRVEREHGASGAGLLCRVHFRGVGAGATPVLVGDAKVWDTRGEPLTVLADGTNVVVR